MRLIRRASPVTVRLGFAGICARLSLVFGQDRGPERVEHDSVRGSRNRRQDLVVGRMFAILEPTTEAGVGGERPSPVIVHDSRVWTLRIRKDLIL